MDLKNEPKARKIGNITRTILALSACCATVSPLQGATLSFGTSSAAGWTVTGGGAVNATPYVLRKPFGYPVDLLAVTSTANCSGAWLRGTSQAKFTGFWVAEYSFYLPCDSSDISLTFTNLTGDDRVGLMLNGQPIGATGTTAEAAGKAYEGYMVLSEGGTNQPYSFAGPNGFVAGTVTQGFVCGGTNTLQAFVNNTFQGTFGTPRGLYGGDFTYFGVSVRVSYSSHSETSAATMVRKHWNSQDADH